MGHTMSPTGQDLLDAMAFADAAYAEGTQTVADNLAGNGATGWQVLQLGGAPSSGFYTNDNSAAIAGK